MQVNQISWYTYVKELLLNYMAKPPGSYMRKGVLRFMHKLFHRKSEGTVAFHRCVKSTK